MRILMLGWEFPPFIAGGLGTACYGLTRALDRLGHEVVFILPRPVDRSEASHVRLLSPETIRGLNVPPTLLQQHILSILRDFRREFPEILVDVFSTHGTGLPPGDIDMGIVFDRPSVDDKVTDLLWMVRVTPVCSPALAARHAGASLQDFLAANELLHVKLEGQPRGLLWSGFSRQCGVLAETSRGLAFDTAIAAVQYAIAGEGVALADIDMFSTEIASGRLVAPYAAVHEDGYGYYLKLHAEDLADPAIALLRSWVIARFAAQLDERQTATNEPV